MGAPTSLSAVRGHPARISFGRYLHAEGVNVIAGGTAPVQDTEQV